MTFTVVHALLSVKSIFFAGAVPRAWARCVESLCAFKPTPSALTCQVSGTSLIFGPKFVRKWGRLGSGPCAKINIMKAIIPQPVHESYKRHRKQLVWQIIMPVVLTSLLLIALIVLINIATFRDGGDVGRWAAISTIWIVIPIMLGLLIVLALVGGLVYLMQKLLNVTPTYTGMAQDYVYLAQGYIKRATEAIVKPVLQLNGILASIIAFFEKMKS
jgi:hypothetical protein